MLGSMALRLIIRRRCASSGRLANCFGVISEDDKESYVKLDYGIGLTKALGLDWDTVSDVVIFNSSINSKARLTFSFNCNSAIL